MSYPAARPVVAPPKDEAAVAGAGAGFGIAGIIFCLIGIALLGAIAIALGVGLGVGLTRSNGSSRSSGSDNYRDAIIAARIAGITSSTTTTTAVPAFYAPAPPGNFTIGAAPVVRCTYGGPSTCGCSATQPLFAAPRIVQGYPAVPNSWPWVVLLTIQGNGMNSTTRECGGFLITYQNVVTAAHCFDGGIQASQVTVSAGIQTVSNQSQGQQRAVSNITINPNYNSSDPLRQNDIAVLTLQAAFNQVSTVGLCCTTSNPSFPIIGEPAVIVGWGPTANNSGDSNVLLQGAVIIQPPTSPQTACPVVTKNGNQFCASWGLTDNCGDDSGGPIMISVNNTWTCIGIVAVGRPDCKVDSSIYTLVGAYTSFINSVISG